MAPTRTAASRACDGCKRRKVKCDTEIPCANCSISQIECAYTIPQKKRGPRSSPKTLSPTPPISLGPASTITGRATNTDTVIVCQLSTVNEPYPSPTFTSNRSLQIIQEGLYLALRPAVPYLNLLEIANNCINLYIQYTFPTAPLVHEPSLRAHAGLMFSNSPSGPLLETHDEQQRISLLRGFTLLTALCASVASVMPENLLPYQQSLIQPFFQASRETLRLFEDHDLECPNSSSIATRVFHSTTLQSMTGKHGASWHLQGEATLIAMRMRLYDEKSLPIHDNVENQLLRLQFWHMYASDYTAATFQDRPFVLDESLFHSQMTLQEYPPQSASPTLLDPSNPWYTNEFEAQLMVGFHFFHCVQTKGARLVLDMRKRVPLTQNERQRLTQLYSEYTGLIDHIPQWLYVSQLHTTDTSEAARFHANCFWVQRCSILVTFHCLRLVIVRQSVESQLYDVVGLTTDSYAVLLKNMELISEFLKTLDDIPFIFLKVKGEPTVERIRKVGSILLELIQITTDEVIKTRARAYSHRLLNVLASLDSKASEALEMEPIN
ncbi:hypothetical protein B0J11DRAFT_430362 [Dendryphion nanum]|uniref:Zn(2)-C6 fungal-type domain-containing protein n=1 Tax=Dendryphion nanum TaxID=256645 RepID=A0A9P9IRR7_9PLEO|nr:hypothetical protein B0J11DRAFT_430362 [Dendryphion nanum]